MNDTRPQTELFLEQVQDATSRAERLVAGAGPDSLTRRPEAGSWSAAECLSHLCLTTHAYLPLLDDALGRAPRSDPTGEVYAPDLMGRWLSWVLEPPYRMRTKTAAAFVPGADADPHALLVEFKASQAELAGRVRRAEGRDLGAVRLVSPFNARVKYNLVSSFSILCAHQRRHLWQAEQTLLALGSAAPHEARRP